MDFVITVTLVLLEKIEAKDKEIYIKTYEKYLADKSHAQYLFMLSLAHDFVEASVYLYQNEDVRLSEIYLTEDGKRSDAIDGLRNRDLSMCKVIDPRLYPSQECWKYFNYMVRYSKYEWKTRTFTFNKKYKDIDIIRKFYVIK